MWVVVIVEERRRAGKSECVLDPSHIAKDLSLGWEMAFVLYIGEKYLRFVISRFLVLVQRHIRRCCA